MREIRILDIFEEGIEYSNLQELELIGIYRIVGSCTWDFLIYRLNFLYFILFFCGWRVLIHCLFIVLESST